MAVLMLSKLMPPEETPDMLNRERLLNAVLHKKQTRIVIITAPAGYGKTVLALQLSRRINKPLVWFHLDHNDNDPALFMHYLLEGLNHHWPGVGQKAQQMFAGKVAISKKIRFIASLIINDLIRNNAKPLIVLDDYHEIKEPTIRSLVQELLDNVPAGVFMIIASRVTIPLSLASKYLAGIAQQVVAAELCFNRQEVARFLDSRYGPQSENTVKAIESYTGGWPAALELAGTLPSNDKLSKIRQRAGMACSLYEYLAAEVFDKLPVIYQDFLVKSSVFQVLEPERCNLLLERDDSEEILNNLDEKLLLLTPLSGTGNTYRCHQLFREFLLDRLGTQKASLQRKAGRLAHFQGHPEIAVEHFLQAGFDNETLEILEVAGNRALKLGRWHTVERWLDQLTEQQVRISPRLSYYQAVIETYRGRLDMAQRWVDYATTGFTSENTSTGLADCFLLKGRLARYRGRYRESMGFLDRVSKYLTGEEIAQHFDLILEKGLCLTLAGDMRPAEKLLRKALTAARKAGKGLAAAYLAETLGHLHYQQGRHVHALRTYREAISLSPDRSLPGYYIQDTVSYIYRDWGELDKAMQWARQSVEARERYELVETLPSAYSALSYVYVELNDFKAVEEYTCKALQVLNAHGEERYFLLLNQAFLAWCRFAQGHWIEAGQLMDNTLAEAEKQKDLACGLVQMLAGTVLALMGNLAKARETLHRAEANLETMNFKTRLCEAYKALAYVYYASEETDLFHKYARKFLHLGARLNFVGNALLATADLLEPSLYFGLQNEVEVLYVQRILARMGQRSHKLLLEMAEHSNPAVRQRVIAPLAEIADHVTIEAINRLTFDQEASVHQAVRSYQHSIAPPLTYDAAVKIKEIYGGPMLDITTFGSFQLFVGTNELSGWRTRKTRELMALLLHLGEPVFKERLIEELWPEIDPRSGKSLLRTNMYYLRRHLEREGITQLIHFEQDRYSFRHSVCNLDYINFDKLVHTGLQEEPLKEIGAGLLTRAVRLYRGDYLADTPDYNWAVPRQIRLKHLYIEALLTLARFYHIRAKNSRAIELLLKLKEADPLCEPAHRLRLQIYSYLGERQALLEEYKVFKLQLLEDFGLPPSPETEALYLRLGCC